MVTEVQRLFTNRNGGREASTTVAVTFKCKRLPERIKIGYISYTVRPFVRPPLRCFKCQRLGHVAAVCKGGRRCCKCGGDHEYGRCGEGVEVKCCNCGGPHSAAYLGCEAQKQAMEAMKYKTLNNVSYAEAVKQVQTVCRDVRSSNIFPMQEKENASIIALLMKIHLWLIRSSL